MRKIALSLILVSGITGNTFAQNETSQTIDDLETDEFLVGGSIWERVEKEVEAKSIQCRKAFPNQSFCSCLASKLPMVLTIPQYTFIVTSSLDELRYDELIGDERKMIDVVREAREECAQHLAEQSNVR